MPRSKKNEDSKSKPYHCSFDQCTYSTTNKSALSRHKIQHRENKEDLKLKCPVCGYATLQNSNLVDHMNTHGDLRPYKCDTEGCTFATKNRGSLSRHRSRHHASRPECDGQSPQGPSRASSRYTSSTGSDGSRRRGRRNPYPPPTISPPVDSPPSPPLSFPDFDASMIAPPGPAYDPEMFSHLPRFNESPGMTGATLNPSLLATHEVQTMQYAQSSIYQQEYPATALPAPLISGVSMNLSEDVFDDFLRRHGEYQPPEASPSVASSSADNSPPSTFATFYPHALDYTCESSFMVPSENENVAPVSLPLYEHSGHSSGTASFNGQFTVQPGPISTQSMGCYYPQTFYNQTLPLQTSDQNSNYSYTAYPGMQGFYTN